MGIIFIRDVCFFLYVTGCTVCEDEAASLREVGVAPRSVVLK